MPDQLPLTTRLRTALPWVPWARWRVAFVAALVIVLGVGVVRHIEKTQLLSRTGTQTKTAFLRWRTQILGEETPGRGAIPGLKRGDDVYRLYNYPNPPVMALILWPFAELPPLAGALTWFALKVGMAAACFVWAFRLCGPMPAGAKAVAVVLGMHPVLGDLSHGNVNIFIAFLVLGALEAFRQRRDVAAGLVLALAVACKVTPALFLPYFVWKRAWKTVAACLLGLGLWWFVVPGAILGWQHNATLLTSWYDEMVRPFLIDGKVTTTHANQSIPGIVFRLLTHQPSDVEYGEDDQLVPTKYHNLTDIGTGPARLVVRGCQAAFVLVVVLLCRSRGRQGLWFAAECSLIVLGMLLFSERTWKHHGVPLMLPYAVLTGFLSTRPAGPALRGYLVGTLVLTGLLTIGPGALPDKDPDLPLTQDLALTYGTHTAAFLLLTAAVCVVMGYERRASVTSTSNPG
jgi:alpha-1,2-mannosyltransferase